MVWLLHCIHRAMRISVQDSAQSKFCTFPHFSEHIGKAGEILVRYIKHIAVLLNRNGNSPSIKTQNIS